MTYAKTGSAKTASRGTPRWRAGALLSALALCGLLVGAGCAGDPSGTDTRSRAIVGGTPDPGEDAVVAVLGYVGATPYLCTGVVIGSRTVLTAAHCVDGKDTVDVIFGADLDDPATISAEMTALSWEIHPSWQSVTPDLFDQHYDLALVLLGADAPAPPVLINRIALTESLFGEPVRLVGFGDTSDGALDSGLRREATTTLRDFDDWWTTAGSQNANTCVGDSGGPQWMQLGGGAVVVGVTSFGTAPPGEELCRFDTIAARVDIAAAEFIDPFLAQHDTPGVCGEDDQCPLACPLPAQDPDCADLCVADGNCVPGCRELDPDCAVTPDAGVLPDSAVGADAAVGVDAGVDPPDGDSGGCAAGHGRSGDGTWLLLLLAGLALVRRRR